MSLLEEGARVAVVSRDRGRAEATASEIGATAALVTDLTQPGSGTTVVADAVDALGGLDIVVVNTGGGRPGGILATFSCSGLVSADLFQKIVFGAALDARRDVQVIERLTQSPDHPVLLSFPEGEYLKGLICRVF